MQSVRVSFLPSVSRFAISESKSTNSETRVPRPFTLEVLLFPGRSFRWLIVFCLSFVCTNSADAGMPSIQLIVTELGRRRLEEVSFFLVGFLLLTAFCRWLWNGLSKEIPSLPKLSYRGALRVMFLWGLALIVVLSLVSGARELMTPAAWEPNGITSRLVKSPAEPKPDALSERKLRLQSLKKILWDYAANHDGRYPDDLKDLDQQATIADPQSGLHYYLTPGLTKGGNKSVLIAEPDIYSDRLSLLTDGTIVVEDRGQGGTP